MQSPFRPQDRTQSMRRSPTASKPQSISPWPRHPTARSSNEGSTMNKHDRSRRQFLRNAAMASMAGMSVSPFLIEMNSVAAMAQQNNSSGYKALVCIFLSGDNDGHGTVIATDSASFNAFTQARSGAPGLAYSMGEVLPITLKTPQSGRTFALN